MDQMQGEGEKEAAKGTDQISVETGAGLGAEGGCTGAFHPARMESSVSDCSTGSTLQQRSASLISPFRTFCFVYIFMDVLSFEVMSE